MSTSVTLRRNGPSVRLRLTFLYGGTVLACGVALLVGIYLLMRYVPNYDLRPTGATVVYDEPHADSILGTPVRASLVPIGSKDDVLAALVKLSGVALFGLVGVAFLTGWIMAGRILAPTHRIASTARTVADDTLHERIRLSGRNNEFTELADAIDTMLDRLHDSFQAQRRFAANASHELRTPLATTRTMLQVALARPEQHELATLVPKLLSTNERSIATVEALLVLARAEHGISGNRSPVDLVPVLEHALEQTHAEAACRGVHVHSVLAPAWIDGDADLLYHLAINLLRNAIRHNHRDGSARLSTDVRDDTVTITVTNTGDTVPAEDVDRFFEPFYRQRGRTPATGHGLGLTLVRTIARSHHGTADATPNPSGGLTTIVTLPAGTRPTNAFEGP